jgi:putative tricarboxylic transport membrane protein
MPTWDDIKRCSWTMLRCTGVGFFLGLLPGCAPSVTTFVAYDLEKRVSKHPERFGKGAIEGVAAPEGANNATSTAGFVPLFSFGLPTAPSMAVLLGGLMMYGLQPGPMLFKENPQFVWAVIASMYIGNVMLLVLNLPLVGMWAKIVKIPFYILRPIIVSARWSAPAVIRFQAFDVWVMSSSGWSAISCANSDGPSLPWCLQPSSPRCWRHLWAQAAHVTGSPLIFFTRPIAAVFMGLGLLSIGRGSGCRCARRDLK